MKNYQFYHMYPLGMLNTRPLSALNDYIGHFKTLQINGIYLGPVFESESHGYDTIDYLNVDQRLGSNKELTDFIRNCHMNDIDIILDCVFNHVSRQFFAFKDVLTHRTHSLYKDWFHIDFNRNNHRNDGFSYQTWDGHDNLVKLNLKNCDVKAYLIDVAKQWLGQFDIDGLRLDAADVMDRQFIRELRSELKKEKEAFFILAEMVHGDYYRMMEETQIDAVTNYECYKGLYSSLNDNNYFEIAHSFKRQFGDKKGLPSLLYNFADNHDVNRVASVIADERMLYPLYLMLYTMPGHTSIYYKSEFGAKGIRSSVSDSELRMPFELAEIDHTNPLYQALRKLALIRSKSEALGNGVYKELILSHQQIGYMRKTKEETVIILINNSDQPYKLTVKDIQVISGQIGYLPYDLLAQKGMDLNSMVVHPFWGCILTKKVEH